MHDDRDGLASVKSYDNRQRGLLLCKSNAFNVAHRSMSLFISNQARCSVLACIPATRLESLIFAWHPYGINAMISRVGGRPGEFTDFRAISTAVAIWSRKSSIGR